MADNVITVPTYEQIETILTKLATDYCNLAAVFYDVFYNTTPMDVTFKMYGEDGILQTYTIPNRAKDMAHLLNGEGSPEGNIYGSLGDIYQDLANGVLYIKETPDGNEGWSAFATQDYLETFILKGVGSPEGNIVANKGALYVDENSAGLYIKSTVTGNTGWVLISANTTVLADTSLSNLTTAGENHFANPSLSNLSTAGNTILDGKEVKSNKVTSITSSSTDTEYPSAKATYNLVSSSVTGFANTNLSNLTDTGNRKFIDWGYVKDCVISAPNGVVTKVDNFSYTIPQGMVLLGANGKTADNKYNNTVVILETACPGVTTGLTSTSGYIFYDYSNNTARTCTKANFIESNTEPLTIGSGKIWFDSDDYTYHYVVEGGAGGTSYWDMAIMTMVGEFEVDSNGYLSKIFPRYPLTLANTRDVNLRVAKSGDTMSDTLSISKSGYDQLKLINTNMNTEVLPASNIHESVVFCNKNGTQIGDCTLRYRPDGSIETYIQASKNNVNSVIGAGVDANNNPYSWFPNTACVDGQWVWKYLQVATNTAVGSYEHSLSTYLPDDNYSYQVWVEIECGYGGSSGGLYVGTIASPYTNEGQTGNFCFHTWVVSNSSTDHNVAILPVGTGRKIYSQIVQGNLGNSQINLVGYRRIGTNG